VEQRAPVEEGVRVAGARYIAALIVPQGQHLDYGAKVFSFAAARACIAEGVGDVGYLLWERLGDGNIEAVSTDVEEGAAVVKAILEAGEIAVDAVDGAKPQNKA
jgi:hypothetical protein